MVNRISCITIRGFAYGWMVGKASKIRNTAHNLESKTPLHSSCKAEVGSLNQVYNP